MLKKDLSIISECFTDTCLVETITPLKKCNHQYGCNNVVKIMKDKYENEFAVGVIDADKRRVSYLNEFDSAGSKNSVTLHKHKTKPHYIIEISPAVEGFILDSAEELGVSLSDYNLPETLVDLKHVTKKMVSKEDPRLKKLFRDLKDASGVKTLSSLLNHLVQERYKTDLDLLKSLLN